MRIFGLHDIFEIFGELRLIPADFQWTDSTPAKFQEGISCRTKTVGNSSLTGRISYRTKTSRGAATVLLAFTQTHLIKDTHKRNLYESIKETYMSPQKKPISWGCYFYKVA